MTTILALLLLWTPATAPLDRAIVHVESRGDEWAVSPAGARGRWQVMPASAHVHPWLLHVPAIGRAEGRRVLGRWLARCKGRMADRTTRNRSTVAYGGGGVKDMGPAMRCALRAYACGTAGLRGACDWYAAEVLREVR